MCKPAWLLLRAVAQRTRNPRRVQEEFEATYTMGRQVGEGSFARANAAICRRGGEHVVVKTHKDPYVRVAGCIASPVP